MSEGGDAWFADGLAFECTRCGACCTGAPGQVRVSEAEARALAAHEGLTLEQWDVLRTRRERGVEGRLLRERPDHACVFWQADGGCEVYALRPLQCRTFPFWRGNLASPAHWAAAGESCPGVGRGALHSSAEIAAALADDGTSGTIPRLDEA